jgi:hypothetical protein
VLGFSDNLNYVNREAHCCFGASQTFKKPLFRFISAIGCDVLRATNAMDWMLGILWILILPSFQYYIQLSFDI